MQGLIYKVVLLGIEPSKHFCDVSFQVLTKNGHRINLDQNILRRLNGIPNISQIFSDHICKNNNKNNEIKNSSDLLKVIRYGCSPILRSRQQLNFQKEQCITQHAQFFPGSERDANRRERVYEFRDQEGNLRRKPVVCPALLGLLSSHFPKHLQGTRRMRFQIDARGFY